MRIGYFDCFSGASGDMILGACLDAGLDLETLRKDLDGLGLPGYTIHAETVRKQGFAATQFDVKLDPAAETPHRHLRHVLEIIDHGRLSQTVRDKARAIFTRLAEAEAAVHGTTIEKVHFHEVGAVDAMVDIVGACIALEHLKIERICCSAIPTGSGTTHCDHGLMPVPAPATTMLLKGIPLATCDEPMELTTPTGAAILTTLAEGFGPMPQMVLDCCGTGSGRREGQTRPNILRLLIGNSADPDEADADQILVLKANLDDISGEILGYIYDRLFEAGALDVYTTPIYMKKSRPATQLTVLCGPQLRGAMEEILFAETTTFGIRSQTMHRSKLARSIESIETSVGPIRIKVGRRNGRIVTAAPEFEDCKETALRTGRPLKEIIDLAISAWRARNTQST